ncbi:2-oxo acid dehydrogenase subunit E2 [Sphingobium lactosutens]|nr:2-oxo acid dehydrogenase subunit E2 [Sphingobium lactosutens]
MSEPKPSDGASIVMPKLGLTMTEGLIVEWMVKPGDVVQSGQTLFVVETDKISNEIEAPSAGTILRLLIEEGGTAAVGAPVAMWTGPAQGQSGPVQPESVDTSALIPVTTVVEAIPPSAKSQRPLCTPFARRLAQQAGIDLATINGSGARGRIRACDIQATVERSAAPALQPVGKGRTPQRERDLRSLIAARVSRSKAEVPHFYLSAGVRSDALAALRGELNTDPRSPRKLSITAFLGLAVGKALLLHPEANVVWRDDRAQPLEDGIAVGIAVEAPGGVMAPVVPIGSGLYDFAASLDAAIDRARRGRMGATDNGAAAIGISNVGMFNVHSLTPIIDPDQSFMLGVGAPRTVFRADENNLPVAAQEMTLNLACDHRAIDGAAAARFLATIVEMIERPVRLLLPVV